MPIPVSKPFQKVTAKDRAYNQVREWIIDGTLMPEEKLGEVELAKSIAVSRTPIREALVKLNQDGFVQMQPGKVTRVAKIELEEVADLYEPMAVIEGLAASQVAAKITEDELHDLVALENEYRQATKTDDIETVLNADREFHQEILTIADNEYETQFSGLLYGHILRYELYIFKKFHFSETAQKGIIRNHDNLLHAIAEHNVAKASSSMTKDWLTTMKVLTDYQEEHE